MYGSGIGYCTYIHLVRPNGTSLTFLIFFTFFTNKNNPDRSSGKSNGMIMSGFYPNPPSSPYPKGDQSSICYLIVGVKLRRGSSVYLLIDLDRGNVSLSLEANQRRGFREIWHFD